MCACPCPGAPREVTEPAVRGETPSSKKQGPVCDAVRESMLGPRGRASAHSTVGPGTGLGGARAAPQAVTRSRCGRRSSPRPIRVDGMPAERLAKGLRAAARAQTCRGPRRPSAPRRPCVPSASVRCWGAGGAERRCLLSAGAADRASQLWVGSSLGLRPGAGRCRWRWQCGTPGRLQGPQRPPVTPGLEEAVRTGGGIQAPVAGGGGGAPGLWPCPEREAPGPLWAPDPGPAPEACAEMSSRGLVSFLRACSFPATGCRCSQLPAGLFRRPGAEPAPGRWETEPGACPEPSRPCSSPDRLLRALERGRERQLRALQEPDAQRL